MSSVITSLLNSTFGLLLTKTRDYTAERLKEGDLTDEQCRKFIVRELDDIKSKLDGLARKDLLSSVRFLEEGVNRLYLSIDTDSPNDETEQEETDENIQANKATMMDAGDRTGGRGELSVLEKALTPLKLSRAVGISGLKITSEERFRSAKESFKSARERATDAFSNEVLIAEDRILAIKLRMASTILESLEDPDAATNDCRLYLQDLHSMPAVKQMFSVYLDGGIIRSLLNKTQRFEIVKSVTMVNFALFGFTKAFTKAPVDLFNWPRIEIDKGSYHPIYDQERKALWQMKNSEEEAPSLGVTRELSEENIISTSAVNSKREIILASREVTANFNVINSQGEIKLFCSLPQEETEGRHFEIHSLAIDDEDNVYIVASFKETDNVYSLKVFVFDPKGNLKHQFPLQFLSEDAGEDADEWPVQIAINMAKNFIVHQGGATCVHVCNKSGQLQYSFPLPLGEYEFFIRAVHLSISDKNEILVVLDRDTFQYEETVYIYTEEGTLKQTIKLPKDHEVRSVAFNHITKSIIVSTEARVSHTDHFLSYSVETGELHTLPLLLYTSGSRLTSHPSGPVAFVHKEGVLFI